MKTGWGNAFLLPTFILSKHVRLLLNHPELTSSMIGDTLFCIVPRQHYLRSRLYSLIMEVDKNENKLALSNHYNVTMKNSIMNYIID